MLDAFLGCTAICALAAHVDARHARLSHARIVAGALAPVAVAVVTAWLLRIRGTATVVPFAVRDDETYARWPWWVAGGAARARRARLRGRRHVSAPWAATGTAIRPRAAESWHSPTAFGARMDAGCAEACGGCS
jgi:hypothetical protein